MMGEISEEKLFKIATHVKYGRILLYDDEDKLIFQAEGTMVDLANMFGRMAKTMIEINKKMRRDRE